MSSLVYKFLSSYFNKFFKNVEHLDLSLKDSKIKIDSIVPHFELFTKLLNLDKFGIKIESGLIKDLVLDFPLNFVKNHIRISCRSVDIYVSEISEEERKLINDASLSRVSSPRSERSESQTQLQNISEETFWESIKDDILANLIIKIEKINVYYFNNKSIIKFEVFDCLFSPSELKSISNNNNEFEYKETLIKNCKKPNNKFRKCLILDKIKASLQESLKDNSNMNKYFLKNLRFVLCLDYFNSNRIQDNILVRNIIIDNFLFDYDILEFFKLYDLISKFINKNLNFKVEDDFDSNTSLQPSSNNFSLYNNSETAICLNNSNINFYHNNNNEECLFYLVIENLNFKFFNYLNENRLNTHTLFPREEQNFNEFDNFKKLNFNFCLNKIFLFIPLSHGSNFMKVVLKNFGSNESTNNTVNFSKKFSLDLKININKEKIKILSDIIYFTLNINKEIKILDDKNEKDLKIYESITNYKLSTGNIILRLDFAHMDILQTYFKNIKEIFVTNFYNYITGYDKEKNEKNRKLNCFPKSETYNKMEIKIPNTDEINENNNSREDQVCQEEGINKILTNLSSSYKRMYIQNYKIKFPNIFFEFGNNANFNDYTTFLPYFNLRLFNTKILSNFTLDLSQNSINDKKNTNLSFSSYSIDSTIKLELLNLITQKVNNFLNDIKINLSYMPSNLLNEEKRNNFIIFVSHINMNIDSYTLNFLNNLKFILQKNNQFLLKQQLNKENSTIGIGARKTSTSNLSSPIIQPYINTRYSDIMISQIKNCTSYVFELLFLQDTLHYVLKPNEHKEIYHKDFKLRFSINDNIYENTFDISQIFFSLFCEEVYNDGENLGENTKTGLKEIINYTKINLSINCSTADFSQQIPSSIVERQFNLFFEFDPRNKLKINLFIFDNIIIINSFPSLSYINILNYLLKRSSEISSVDKFYHDNYLINLYLLEKNNFSLKNYSEIHEEFRSPVLSFLCDNILFLNLLNSEIEVEINYTDKKEIITIPPREEKSIMIIFENIISINLIIKICSKLHSQNTTYYSEDITALILSEKISSFHPITFAQTKMMQKVKSSVIQNNSFNLNFTVEDFNKSSFFYSNSKEYIVKKTNKHTDMKIVKLLPNLVIRNFAYSTLLHNSLSLYFVINSFCDKVNEKFIIKDNVNTINPLYDLENNLYEINRSEVESTYLLNENSNNNSRFILSQIKFCVKFINFYYEENIDIQSQSQLVSQSTPFYFSDKISIDSSSSKMDYIICIKTVENLFFIFRINMKNFNDDVISLTISSFLNFYFKNSPGVDNIILKNKNEILNSLNYKSEINVFSNHYQIDKSTDVNFDTLYSVHNKKKSFNVDINDIFSFIDFSKNLQNDVLIYINNDFNCILNFHSLFITEGYQLNTNNSSNFLNKEKNKIFHVRFLHYPFFVCEIYDTPFYHSRNFYIHIENKYKKNIIFFTKLLRNDELLRFECLSESINNFSMTTSVESMLIETEIFTTSDSKSQSQTQSQDFYLFRYSTQVDSRKIKDESRKFGIDVKVSHRLNHYVIVIDNYNSSCVNSISLKECKSYTDQTSNFSFTLTDLDVNLSLLPFSVTNSSYKKMTEINFKVKKILASYTETIIRDKYIHSDIISRKKMMNFSIAEFDLNYDKKLINENITVPILKTKYLTDIRLESENLKFGLMEENHEKNNRNEISLFSIKLNFPYETEILIEDSLLQFTRFFFLQLSYPYINNNYFKNLNVSKLALVELLPVRCLENIYNLNSIALNDFSIIFNVEYKKGLSISVKNSKIIHRKSEIKNLTGNFNQVLNELKNNFMKNFFKNVYNLLKSTELFGNFNGLLEEIKGGLKRFKERPLTTGIFSLLYASVKGSFSSVYGIGKSLTLTIRNFNRSNYDSPIYFTFSEIIKENLIFNRNNMHLIVCNLKKILEHNNTKIQLNQFLNKIIINEKDDDTSSMYSGQSNTNSNTYSYTYLTQNCNHVSNYFSELYSKFYRQSFVHPIFASLSDSLKDENYKIKNLLICRNMNEKNDNYLLLITNYFFLICTKNQNCQNSPTNNIPSIKVEYLIPFLEICKMSTFSSRNSIIILLKNGSTFEFTFSDRISQKFFKYEILDKFE